MIASKSFSAARCRPLAHSRDLRGQQALDAEALALFQAVYLPARTAEPIGARPILTSDSGA
jgi:hypothetical protein